MRIPAITTAFLSLAIGASSARAEDAPRLPSLMQFCGGGHLDAEDYHAKDEVGACMEAWIHAFQRECNAILPLRVRDTVESRQERASCMEIRARSNGINLLVGGKLPRPSRIL